MAESQKVQIASKVFNPTGETKGKGNPVIFLHAMLCSKEIWSEIPQTVANKTGRTVYTYDARNHGESGQTEESNFSFNVEDLFSFMDKVKAEIPEHPEQFILVGHDMGGMTAISAALKQPAKFEKVFVLEMYAKKIPDELVKRAKVFMSTWTECVKQLPKATPLADVTKTSVENLYKQLPKDMQEDNEKMSYQKGNFLYKETEQGYDVLYNTKNLENALDELLKMEDYQGEYDRPAFFLYGTGSHYKVADEKEAMKKHFPKAALVPFQDASHFFIADIPAELAEELGKRINE